MRKKDFIYNSNSGRQLDTCLNFLRNQSHNFYPIFSFPYFEKIKHEFPKEDYEKGKNMN